MGRGADGSGNREADRNLEGCDKCGRAGGKGYWGPRGERAEVTEPPLSLLEGRAFERIAMGSMVEEIRRLGERNGVAHKAETCNYFWGRESQQSSLVLKKEVGGKPRWAPYDRLKHIQ